MTREEAKAAGAKLVSELSNKMEIEKEDVPQVLADVQAQGMAAPQRLIHGVKNHSVGAWVDGALYIGQVWVGGSKNAGSKAYRMGKALLGKIPR